MHGAENSNLLLTFCRKTSEYLPPKLEVILPLYKQLCQHDLHGSTLADRKHICMLYSCLVLFTEYLFMTMTLQYLYDPLTLNLHDWILINPIIKEDQQGTEEAFQHNWAQTVEFVLFSHQQLDMHREKWTIYLEPTCKKLFFLNI